jgi:hypothetical protein
MIGRDAALPHRRLHPRRRLSAGRPGKRIVESMARPRNDGRRAWWPATPRWWSRARATACSSPPPASASCRTACTSPATWRGRATCMLVSGSMGDHGVAIMSQAGEPLLRRPHPVRHGGAERLTARHAGSGAGDPRHARPDARRPGRHHQRDRPPVRRRHAPGGSRHPGEAGGGRRLRTARPRSSQYRQRGQAHRHLRRRGRGQAACRDARPSPGPGSGDHRQGGGGPQLLRADEDRLRRQKRWSTGSPASSCRGFAECASSSSPTPSTA